MEAICINTRDELNLIPLDLVACVQADGNYSKVMYIDGNKLTVSLGLSQMEELVKNATKDDKKNVFIRLGRSILINFRYLSQINIPKQKLTLSDRGRHAYQLNASKPLLKNLKELIRNQYNK